MVRENRSEWKANYFTRILGLFDEFKTCLIVGVDNVGSKQMQEIRQAMRGHGEIIMGKNTMIRKAIRGHLSENPQLEKLLPYVVGNVGFVFTKEDLGEIRKLLLENKRGAPAKAGAIAPCDVKLPPQNTGMGPEKTSFFQALQIPTKISRGTIEILNEVHLIKLGEKVGASESALLNMLNIMPFSYGLAVQQVFDNGTIYSPDVLDVTSDDLRARFLGAVRNVAAVSLSVGYPTKASAPHSIANGFKNLLAVAAATDVTFKQAEKLKAYLADPSKFAAAGPAPTTGTTVASESTPAVAKVEEAKEESEDEDMDSYAYVELHILKRQILGHSCENELVLGSITTMLIYKDAFTDDELASDSFPMKLVDDLIYEFKGKHVVRKEGEIVLAGSNPSAEGEDGDDGADEAVERGIDFILNHKLQEMNCYEDPSTFKQYIKEFMKKVVDLMKKNDKSDADINDFKKKIQSWVVSLLAKDRFKNLQFFIGENMAEGRGEGQVAIVEYREEAEGENPYLMLVKEALITEKC
ncbi:Ribosomal protein L10 [Aphelenchoides besseyi]|nr:Ribosomal protein L10 [Aphelenchoides besseyi]KAI6221549.1 Ribosomal protein L10 [Aphelenchoides besseyi]